MQVIQVDFEGRNPMASDFHGIRQLLQQLFLKSDINLSELTDIVTGMNVFILFRASCHFSPSLCHSKQIIAHRFCLHVKHDENCTIVNDNKIKSKLRS